MRCCAVSKAIAARAAVLLSLAVAAGGQTAGEDTASAMLAVVVLDESQLPVPAAKVEIKVGDQVLSPAPRMREAESSSRVNRSAISSVHRERVLRLPSRSLNLLPQAPGRCS